MATDPHTRPERNTLVWDVLTNVWMDGRGGGRDREVKEMIRAQARRLLAQRKRWERYEVSFETIGDLPDTRAEETTPDPGRERGWQWVEASQACLSRSEWLAIEGRRTGMDDADIARRIGCAETSVPSLRARGLRKLRRRAKDARRG